MWQLVLYVMLAIIAACWLTGLYSMLLSSKRRRPERHVRLVVNGTAWDDWRMACEHADALDRIGEEVEMGAEVV